MVFCKVAHCRMAATPAARERYYRRYDSLSLLLSWLSSPLSLFSDAKRSLIWLSLVISLCRKLFYFNPDLSLFFIFHFSVGDKKGKIDSNVI